MAVAETLNEEVVRLRLELRKKEEECEMLRGMMEGMENKIKGMNEKTDRMKKEMGDRQDQTDRRMQDLYNMMTGAGSVPGPTTLTPAPTEGTPLNGMDGSRVESKEDTVSGRKGGEWKRVESKRGSKHGSKVKDRKARGKSVDSLYSDEGESDDMIGMSETESSSSESEVNVGKGILIREVPRIDKFRLHGGKSMDEFFGDFERYCKLKYPQNKGHWVSVLGDCLDGKVLEFLRVITSVGEPKYDVVKKRLIGQVKRMKESVKYKRVNEFEKARMGKSESVNMYAHRLESMARTRYGDDDVNECKPLMRKFLDTIPRKVSEWLSGKRKERVRLTGERLMWEDVLELLEDGRFDDESDLEEDGWYSVNVGGKKPRSFHPPQQFVSYRDALKAAPAGVMSNFLGRQNGWANGGWSNGRGQMNFKRGNGYMREKPRYVPANERPNGGRKIVECRRCGRKGHMLAECRWTSGACFGCGKKGHMIKDCQESVKECFECKEIGHLKKDCPRLNGGATGGESMKYACGNCGKAGHYARMCRDQRNVCSYCAMEGHSSEKCWIRLRAQGVNGKSEAGN